MFFLRYIKLLSDAIRKRESSNFYSIRNGFFSLKNKMQTFFRFFFQMEIESAGGVIIKKNKKDVTHCGFGNSS
jgi:hypothetical protein